MINYHTLFPQYSKQHNAEYLHYLSLGSHSSPYNLSRIVSFSVITLYSHQNLPQIQNNPHKQYFTQTIVLKGTLKINGQTYAANLNKNQVIGDPINIANQSQQTAVFAYLVVRKGESQKSASQMSEIIVTNQQHQDLVSSHQIIYVINGKIFLNENQTEIAIKNDLGKLTTIPAIYTSEKTKIRIEPSTYCLKISDCL